MPLEAIAVETADVRDAVVADETAVDTVATDVDGTVMIYSEITLPEVKRRKGIP